MINSVANYAYFVLAWFWAFCSAIAFSLACRLHLYRWFWNQIFTWKIQEMYF